MLLCLFFACDLLKASGKKKRTRTTLFIHLFIQSRGWSTVFLSFVEVELKSGIDGRGRPRRNFKAIGNDAGKQFRLHRLRQFGEELWILHQAWNSVRVHESCIRCNSKVFTQKV